LEKIENNSYSDQSLKYICKLVQSLLIKWVEDKTQKKTNIYKDNEYNSSGFDRNKTWIFVIFIPPHVNQIKIRGCEEHSFNQTYFMIKLRKIKILYIVKIC
jgi:hypothetical protein